MMRKIILLFLFLQSFLHAHPHIWVESSIAVVLNKNENYQIKVSWIFDEMFSNIIFEDYDLDKNKVFDEGERKLIEKEAFSNLINYDYYLYLFVNNVPQKIAYSDFEISVDNKKVVYDFTVPFRLKSPRVKNVILIANFDKEIFTDIVVRETPLVVNTKGLNCSLEQMENYEYEENLFPQAYSLVVQEK